MVRPSAVKLTSSSTHCCWRFLRRAAGRQDQQEGKRQGGKGFQIFASIHDATSSSTTRALGFVEHLVVELRVDLEVRVLGPDALHQVPAALHRDQLVLLAVHHQQRRRQGRGALRHGLADADERPGDACGQLAVMHQRVGVVGGHHGGVAGHRVGGQLFDGQAGHDLAERLGEEHHHRRHPVLGVDRRARQHHRGVVVGVLDAVGEHDAAAHAVAEHDAVELGVLGGRDTDEGVEVVGVFGDVTQVDPLAAGAAVSAQVEGVDHEAGLAEALRDVVVAAGVLGVAVTQHDDAAGSSSSGSHTS